MIGEVTVFLVNVWKQVFAALGFGIFLPSMLFSVGTGGPGFGQGGLEPPVGPSQQIVEKEQDPKLTIPVLKSDGQVYQMDLEDYIGRVVLGEMPASFEMDALKAQAVAARTYTLRCVQEGDRHPDGAVCTDYRCCQEYVEPEDYLAAGGTQKNVDKVFRAVEQTHGEVLRYGGELIYATYFASAGGSTEDAQAVWGQAFPYLTVVSSPEMGSAYDGEQVSFTPSEFQDRLGVQLQGDPKEWFGKVSYTAGKGVDRMWIGGRSYSGIALRRIFGLRSTIFTITASKDRVTFETIGYGHRVGLSQYGADAMAVQGNDYHQILEHYYPGAALGQYSIDTD